MRTRILLLGSPDREGYLQTYASALRGGGAEPVLAWPGADIRRDPVVLRGFLGQFSGLVVPGGKDVEPWRFGEQPHRRLGETDAELDEVELALAHLALETDFPTLAICRGIQVMGVSVGGGLYQDLPSQRPNGLEHNVRTTPSTLAHEVDVAEGSRLRDAVGSGSLAVNSRHHQAVRDDGTEQVGALRIVARAPDGVVEGLEAPGHRFFVGVQWHPENLVGSGEEARRLFRGFVEACGG
jgi:putative glutamine amidotransferase